MVEFMPCKYCGRKPSEFYIDKRNTAFGVTQKRVTHPCVGGMLYQTEWRNTKRDLVAEWNRTLGMK